MKVFVALLALAAISCAVNIPEPLAGNTAYGYLKNIGIPEAERIRKAEEQNTAIVGDVSTALVQYPYLAGLLLSINGMNGTGVCGGSLISDKRVLTAAHCWYDGVNQAKMVTVVIGSSRLFSGGTRINSSVVTMNPNWTPSLIRNDIALVSLSSSVTFSASIAPITLPSGVELEQSFAGESAIASGFGIANDGSGNSTNQFLSHVNLNVITNSACSVIYPLSLQDSNICTIGIGGVSACSSYSGGPLTIKRANRTIVIGVISYGSARDCRSLLPAAYTRVTSFMSFITQHL